MEAEWQTRGDAAPTRWAFLRAPDKSTPHPPSRRVDCTAALQFDRTWPSYPSPSSTDRLRTFEEEGGGREASINSAPPPLPPAEAVSSKRPSEHTSVISFPS